MKKDAYYFPHYCNARHDRKIKRLRKELGTEGYGIYFMLLEVLREQTDFRYPIDELDLLADEFDVSEQKVRVVVCNYDLFTIDEQNNFFSMKQIYYLQPYLEKVERARNAAFAKWQKIKDLNTYDISSDANAEQMQCVSNARKGKESKVNESKGDIINNNDLGFEILDDFSFDLFWDLYDKKTGRDKSMMLYSKLSKDDKEKIFNHIPLYKQSRPDKQYRKDPQTYLRNRTWEDEVIIQTEQEESKYLNLFNIYKEIQDEYANKPNDGKKFGED